MTAYRLDGFSFNRDNLRGIDADALAGINQFLNAREREINTIETASYICAGGPFHGQPIEVETLHMQRPRTAVISVGKWTGYYEIVPHSQKPELHAAQWRGNDAPAPDSLCDFYGVLRAPAKPAKRFELGRGFVQLGELLANMGQEHEGETVAFTIGRARFTVANTPEAVERLRARILKAKKWFADKLLQAPRTAQAAPELARDLEQAEAIERAAVQDVAQVVAMATAAAAIAQAATDGRQDPAHQVAHQVPELATVGATASEGARAAQAPVLATGRAIGAPSGAPGATSPTGGPVRPFDVTHAAQAVERITNLWQHDGARRRAIDAGRSGDATALPAILAILLRIAAHGAPDDQRAARDALRELRGRPATPASDSPGPHTPHPAAPIAPVPGPAAAHQPGDDTTRCKTSPRLHETPQDLEQVAPAQEGEDFDTIEPDALTVDQVARWPAGQASRLVNYLEDINLHGECLTVRALHIGREDLAAQARAINREHLQAGSLSMELSQVRYTLGQRIRAAELGQDGPDGGPGATQANTPSAGQPSAPVPGPMAPDLDTGNTEARKTSPRRHEDPRDLAARPGNLPASAPDSPPGPAIPLRPDQVPPGSAWARWRAAITRFDEIFSMPIIDHLTGAELQTLREACGLSREELGHLADVHARTIKHWENGRAGVPSDVAALVQRLDDTLHTAAQHAIATYTGAAAPPAGVVLLRYANAEDLHRYRPDLVNLPASVHGAIVGRVRAGLRHLPGFEGQPVRVVWLEPQAYDAWRQAAQLPDSEAARTAWATHQVRAQAIPHRADQPPPA
jgi:DNA-binding XRE family transcriptional regulator